MNNSENRTVANDELLSRMEALETSIARLSLQMASIQGLLEAESKSLPPAPAWLTTDEAVQRWGKAKSTLRKYRNRKIWSDGSIPWIEGVHWKRGHYNKALVDHWFTYRHDHQTHRDFCQRWLDRADKLPD